VWGNLGIALGRRLRGTLNHVPTAGSIAQMARTPRAGAAERTAERAPGRWCSQPYSGVSAMAILPSGEPVDRGLTFLSLIGYAVVYTVWLKRADIAEHRHPAARPGGAAGVGWAAVTTADPNGAAAFLIIFVWTPPHFWALAIAPPR